MKSILALFFFGLLMHQTKRLSDHAPAGWRNLTEHAVGGVGIFIAWPHMARAMGADKGQVRIGETALAVALLGIGAGVSFGWITDTLLEKVWKKKRAPYLS